jgi:histo-blood group ABO system transferase
MKIAVLNIATGPYIGLFERSKECIKNNFLTSHEVDLFLFTDSEEKYVDDDIDIKQYYVKRRGYPGDTLFRYHYFLLAEEELKEYDYIFYIDVDMNVVSEVNEDIFGDLVATLHPGFYKRSGATFESRKSSTAYVEPTGDTRYFCGGFQGGKSENYLNASKKIKENINIDGKKRIIAIWHDESHWNAYLCQVQPTLVLDPKYCYPEEGYAWLDEFKDTKKIIATIKDEEKLRNV